MLQVAPHVEAAQVAIPFAGTLQALPQLPQFIASATVEMQAAPQSLKLVLQATPQWPAVQVAVPFIGIGHAIPHMPQLSGAVMVSTQEPAQLSFPAEQTVLHLLLSQTCPAAQDVSHPPHRAGSLVTSTQAPAHFA
jgi:hypothetical protein